MDVFANAIIFNITYQLSVLSNSPFPLPPYATMIKAFRRTLPMCHRHTKQAVGRSSIFIDSLINYKNLSKKHLQRFHLISHSTIGIVVILTALHNQLGN